MQPCFGFEILDPYAQFYTCLILRLLALMVSTRADFGLLTIGYFFLDFCFQPLRGFLNVNHSVAQFDVMKPGRRNSASLWLLYLQV